MLSKEILQKIESKEIKSRQQLYSHIGGRSKKKLQWLNDNEILLPRDVSKNAIINELKQLKEKLNRLPISSDDWGLTRLCQTHFGGWNIALKECFGEVNQKRYVITIDNIVNEVEKFISQYGRIPLRYDFDGKQLPYFEAVVTGLKLKNWSELYLLKEFDHIMDNHRKHGFGQISIFEGKLYLSSKELEIGKFLYCRGINFEKEVPYQDSNNIFDFFIPSLNVYIEYYGIKTEEYENRIKEKRKHYGDLNVFEIFKYDNIEEKLVEMLNKYGQDSKFCTNDTCSI